MTRVFISHSTHDQDFVEKELIELLHRHGVDTWYMRTHIRSAADWADTVLEALEACDWFLVVLSPHSVASEWVKDEVHWAIDHRQGRIVTVLVEECRIDRLHIRLPRIQHVDFRADLEAAREQLLATWHIQYRPAPRTEMQLLVEKHSLCRYVDGKLVPCQYHRDRMEVRLYERAGYEGEVDLSDTVTRLAPHPQLLDLLARMRMKTQVAGHWGLMREHRDWIAAGLRDSIASRSARGQGTINILQCGVAGLVHYFANEVIVLEQLDHLLDSTNRPPKVLLSTRDLCPGSIRPIEVMLERLRERESQFRFVNVDGCVISIDETFWDLASRVNLLDSRVEHDLAVQDLTSGAWGHTAASHYDVVMAHHLFSMWSNEAEKVGQLCENLRTRTVPGSDLYLAMNTNRNDPSRLDLDGYHEIFGAHGFAVAEARLAWDVYDLDPDAIDALLLERQEIDVVKDTALVHYVRME